MMKLVDFVKLFDKTAIKDGRIMFTFYSPVSGKWNYWSTNDTVLTVEKLVSEIEAHDDLKNRTINSVDDVEFDSIDYETLRIRIAFYD